MGNHKFRFSDMMPHSWLYKLKGISRRRKHLHPSPSLKNKQHSSEASSSRKVRGPLHPEALNPRFSDLSPPNSSIKRRTRRKTVYKPSPRLKLSSSVPSSVKSHVSLSSSRSYPTKSSIIDPEPSDCAIFAVTSSSRYVLSSPGEDYGSARDLELRSCDIVIDMKDGRHVKMLNDISGLSSASEVEYLTQSMNLKKLVPVENVKEVPLATRTQHKLSSVGRKSNAGSSGIKLRVNSPKIARKKTRVSSSSAKRNLESKKKGIAESFAIVLSSVDPERDFRESMVEMIVENNIREQKDLEDLLACYLSLNSSEYHDVIIKAFEKTWFQLTNSSL